MKSRILRNVCVAVLGGLTLYGGNIEAATTLNPPTPVASKGTYSTYVRLSWSKVAGSSGYVIKRGTTSTYSKATELKKITSANTLYLYDSSAVANKTYYYWVCPCNAKGVYWYNTGRWASGYRSAAVVVESLTLSSSTVTAGTKVYIYYRQGGQYAIPSSLTYSASSGCAKVYTYSGLSGFACGYITTSKAGTVTVKAGSASAKLTVSSGSSPTSAYIQGPSSLRYGNSGSYYLYVGGKKITASSVAWSRSGLATMQDKGYYGYLKATSKPASTNKVTVYAQYNGKKYTKTVTITK